MSMRVLFAGTPAIAAKVLDVLAAQGPSHGYSVSGVLTRTDAPVGRKKRLMASPVAYIAERLKLPVIKANRIDPTVLAAVAGLNVEVAAVVAYGVLLPSKAIDALPLGWINLHYSLLPAWRGAAPVQACLRAGKDVTGTTVFRIDAGMDTGDVLDQRQTAIGPEETAGGLLDRLSDSGAMQLAAVLARQSHAAASGTKLAGIPQEEIAKKNNCSVSYAPKITRADARISWEAPGNTIVNLVRAMNPEPGAWSFVRLPREDGALPRIKIMQARLAGPEATELNLGAGEVHQAGGGNVWAGSGDGTVVEILQVHPEGKKMMAAAEWIRGVNRSGRESVGFRMVSPNDGN